MVNPYADTVSAGFSRQLGADMAINVDGVNTKSNAFNAGVADQHAPSTACDRFPRWGNITQVQSIGWQKYRALLVRLEKRLSSRYQYTLSYTLQKVTDNSFGATSTGTITDAAHPEYDEGYGNADRRHAMVASGAYLLPGDVTLGMVWTLRSTAPFSARAGLDLNGDGATTDYVPGTHKGQGNRDLDIGARERLAGDQRARTSRCLQVQQERLQPRGCPGQQGVHAGRQAPDRGDLPDLQPVRT